MSIPATKLKERFGDSRKRRPNKLETKPSRLHRTLTAEGVDDDDMPEFIEDRLVAIEKELAALENRLRARDPADIV